MIFLIEGIVRMMSWCVDIIEKHTRWRYDLHPKPHLINSFGGCACFCDRCVRGKRDLLPDEEDYFRCICERCNEECPSVGRLGNSDTVYIEREQAGEPKNTKVGRVWYRVD